MWNIYERIDRLYKANAGVSGRAKDRANLVRFSNIQSIKFFVAHMNNVIQGLFNDISSLKQLFFSDAERRSEANDVDVSRLSKQATGLQEQTQLPGWLVRFGVVNDNSVQETTSTNWKEGERKLI